MNEQTIKLFLRTKTPEGLQLLMLDNNIVRGVHYNYDIVHANGLWYAWFLGDATKFITDEAKKLDLQRLNKS